MVDTGDFVEMGTAAVVAIGAAAVRRGLIAGGREPRGDRPLATFFIEADGLTVSVDAAGSTDRDGTIESYEWDFGPATATGVQAQYAYANEGEKTIRLTVTDDDGNADSFARVIQLDADGFAPGSYGVDGLGEGFYGGGDSQTTTTSGEFTLVG